MNEIERILHEDAVRRTKANQSAAVPETPRKKKKWRIIICVLVMLMLLFFFVPRILLWNIVKKIVPDGCTRSEYYAEFDAVGDGYLPVETEFIKFSVPPTMIYQKENDSSKTVYWDKSNPEITISVYNEVPEYPVILDRSNFSSMSDDTYEMLEPLLKEVFGSLGYGLPDSSYHSLKCIHLLDASDRSFWSLKKLCAIWVYGLLKQEMDLIGKPYIYESENACGILQILEIENDIFCFASLYHPERLNENTVMIARLETPEALYSVLNSIEMK